MEIGEIPLDKALSEGVHWFVTLRWFAGGALFTLGLAAVLFFPNLEFTPVMWLGAAIVGYNILIRLSLRTLGPRNGLHLQILLDWLSLVILCHFTMGLESPFIPFFVFHVILASMFMSRRACLRHGLIAIGLISLMTFLEHSGAIPLIRLPEIGLSPRHDNLFFLLLSLGSVSALILLTIFLSTNIIQRLRRGEEKAYELQTDLGQAYQKLKEIDQERNRFVRVVSHELRSPLAASQSMLQVILEGYTGDISPKARELVHRSERRIVQLLELVNELLDFIRGARPLEEGAAQDIGVEPSARKILNELAAHAANKEIRLHIELSAKEAIFRGDAQDLERIFLNLVGNAIKYTPEKGTVTVRGRLDGENLFLFEVSDTGIGIPEGELPLIFDEFYRASNAKKEKREGTGLGLSIVKKTVEKYGGRLTAASRLGKGSTFSVWLPVTARKE